LSDWSRRILGGQVQNFGVDGHDGVPCKFVNCSAEFTTLEQEVKFAQLQRERDREYEASMIV